MAMAHRTLPRRGSDLDRPPCMRRDHLGDSAERGGCAGCQIEHTGRAVGDDLQDEVHGVIRIQMVARFLAVAEQRNAPVLDRLAQEFGPWELWVSPAP